MSRWTQLQTLDIKTWLSRLTFTAVEEKRDTSGHYCTHCSRQWAQLRRQTNPTWYDMWLWIEKCGLLFVDVNKVMISSKRGSSAVTIVKESFIASCKNIPQNLCYCTTNMGWTIRMLHWTENYIPTWNSCSSLGRECNRLSNIRRTRR